VITFSTYKIIIIIIITCGCGAINAIASISRPTGYWNAASFKQMNSTIPQFQKQT
jgi:hypothetical protein